MAHVFEGQPDGRQADTAIPVSRSGDMTDHTPTPWMTQPCGELLPDDVMIVADLGKNSDGIQAISTVARALSIRQTREVTAANAAFIVKAVNNHTALIEALRPFAWYFDVNDCKDRSEDDALEVPIRDLRIAFELFEALGPSAAHCGWTFTRPRG